MFDIPIGTNGQSYLVEHQLAAHDGSMAYGNSTVREDFVLGAVDGGSSPPGLVLVPTVQAKVAAFGAGATRIGVTYAGTTRKMTVTLSSATYGTSGAFARLETKFIGEQAG